MKYSYKKICMLLCCTILSQISLATNVQSDTNDVENTDSIVWEYESIQTDGSELYYLYHIATDQFLADDDTFSDEPALLWTVNGQDIASVNGKHISITSRNAGTTFRPNYVFESTAGADAAATSNIESHDTYYTIGNKVNINLLQQKVYYLASDGKALTATQDAGEQSQWLFISTTQVDSKKPALDEDEQAALERQKALERLQAAVDKAQQIRDEVTDVPGLSKTVLDAELTSARAILNGSALSSRIPVSTIDSLTESLSKLSNQFLTLSDYYTACLAAISNIEQISSGFTVRSLVTTAKTSLQAAATKEAMTTAMNVLRTGITTYLQTINTFEDGKSFTGLIGNHSFDTGDMAQWYSVAIDMSKVNISDLTAAISKGEVGALADAIAINEWKDGTYASRAEGEDGMADTKGRYYLHAEQMLMEPILGLPAGIYELKANMACKPGLLKTDKVHMSALVVPSEIVQQVLGDVTSGDLSNIDLTKYIGTFLQSGLLNTHATLCKSLDEYSEATVRFVLNKGDVVILGMNGGIAPFIGTAIYKADDLQLTYLRSANGLMDIAKETLKQVLDGKSEIKANCQSGAPFSYDPEQTEAYNTIYRDAKEKYDDKDITPLLKGINLYDLDNLDQQIAGFYDKEADALEEAWATFCHLGFIAPSKDSLFNITMKDDWFTLTGNKWTGNALTFNNDSDTNTMAFSSKPGESNFLQAVGFVNAGTEYPNQLFATIVSLGDTLYLAYNDDKLWLTADKADALMLTVTPSATVEGQQQIAISEELNLGTTQQNNVLAAVGKGSTLNPTRSGLSIVPAASHTVQMTVPEYGVATLMLPYTAAIPDDVHAFSVSEVGGEDGIVLQLCEEQEIEACKPYIVMSAPGEYTFSGISQAMASEAHEGLLAGSLVARATEESEYVLQQQSDYVGFYAATNDATLQPNQCCVCFETKPAARAYYLDDNTVVGIHDVMQNDARKNASYTVIGLKASKNAKGIIITDGKKRVK